MIKATKGALGAMAAILGSQSSPGRVRDLPFGRPEPKVKQPEFPFTPSERAELQSLSKKEKKKRVLELQEKYRKAKA